MREFDKVIKGLECCMSNNGDCEHCPYDYCEDCQNGYEGCMKDALTFLKAMYEQIEDTHSCKLCALTNICSPDAPFDSDEYQVFAGCHGSLKENWCWKGVDEE